MQVVLSKEMLLKVFSCGTKICMVSTNSLYMFSSRSFFFLSLLFLSVCWRLSHLEVWFNWFILRYCSQKSYLSFTVFSSFKISCLCVILLNRSHHRNSYWIVFCCLVLALRSGFNEAKLWSYITGKVYCIKQLRISKQQTLQSKLFMQQCQLVRHECM